jgi:hypothetical protein
MGIDDHGAVRGIYGTPTEQGSDQGQATENFHVKNAESKVRPVYFGGLKQGSSGGYQSYAPPWDIFGERGNNSDGLPGRPLATGVEAGECPRDDETDLAYSEARSERALEKAERALQEPVEATGVAPQSRLLAANQAQVRRLADYLRLTGHAAQAAARFDSESQARGVDSLLKLGHDRVDQGPCANGDFPAGFLPGGDAQISHQNFPGTASLRRIREHPLRIVIFPPAEQRAQEILAVAKVVIKRPAGNVQPARQAFGRNASVPFVIEGLEPSRDPVVASQFSHMPAPYRLCMVRSGLIRCEH